MRLRLPRITEKLKSPLVVKLLEMIKLLREELQAMRNEIAILKGLKPKPKFKSSKLASATNKPTKPVKRPGSKKRDKTNNLIIHETVIVKAENIPEGSVFKGYSDFTQQDLVIKPFNTTYRMERWLTPSGTYIKGQLSDEIAQAGHFGVNLQSFIVHQYQHGGVTQPLIAEQVREFGIDISSGMINNIITEKKEKFFIEKGMILETGLGLSSYVNVDDTGARHDGKNGYCTHIGNEYFAWFKSTRSKSRINFLELLSCGKVLYCINNEAIEYMEKQGLSKSKLNRLNGDINTVFPTADDWESYLKTTKITSSRHIRIATEGALLGSLLKYVIHSDLKIVSDDAGQFNILQHALCWVHAERTIKKIIGFNQQQRQALDAIINQIWDFYRDLKAYKVAPEDKFRVQLEQRFDDIFSTKTCYASLNLALNRIKNNKSELLLVLKHPDLPLHNNLSENDIREYVKKRKISGSTRSETGRDCRDTFTSLKKTCRKLGISFWKYLKDRISQKNQIPPLSTIVRQRILDSG